VPYPLLPPGGTLVFASSFSLRPLPPLPARLPACLKVGCMRAQAQRPGSRLAEVVARIWGAATVRAAGVRWLLLFLRILSYFNGFYGFVLNLRRALTAGACSMCSR
jgi:hypothetical protein